jgi:hypothetical protein
MSLGVAFKNGGLGKFHHYRQFMPIDKQDVVRANRDTLHSTAPVTITLPAAGERFMSMAAFDEDRCLHGVVYGAGKYVFTKQQICTCYVRLAVRTLVDPANAKNMEQVHALQDAIKVEQSGFASKFPTGIRSSQRKTREESLALGSTLPDLRIMFGTKDEVDPVRHLIGTVMAWGELPASPNYASYEVICRRREVNTHLTVSSPRCLVFRNVPTVFIQPKTSSIRFRIRWPTL